MNCEHTPALERQEESPLTPLSKGGGQEARVNKVAMQSAKAGLPHERLHQDIE
ncbi:hypothetical protein [Moorena producens]|uniref:hypothetical protein n=1 Tax=Moorena producens TaxID=1155739 RepID=UPI001314CD31|nr:hypothetical protein [Moorena producens]